MIFFKCELNSGGNHLSQRFCFETSYVLRALGWEEEGGSFGEHSCALLVGV